MFIRNEVLNAAIQRRFLCLSLSSFTAYVYLLLLMLRHYDMQVPSNEAFFSFYFPLLFFPDYLFGFREKEKKIP